MPTTETWVPPELFFTHNGVNVFYTYRDNDIDQGVNSFWYTLNARDDDETEQFDVRDLPAWQHSEDHKAIITQALDNGDLEDWMPSDPGDNEVPAP
jgi:hypothetical protein